jgi:hypothetical protein
MKKNQKHIINITQWKGSVLDVSEIIAESLEEAKNFIRVIFGKDIKVKIYDSFRRLIYTEIINNIREEHEEHEHHDHDDYNGRHDHDGHGHDRK